MIPMQPLRVLRRYASVAANGAVIVDDIGGLLEDILLFEHVIVDSLDLAEIGALVRAFGPGAVVDLLKAGCVSFTRDALFLGVSGSNHLPPRSGVEFRHGAIAVGSVGVVEEDRRAAIHDAMAGIAKDAGVSGKARTRLTGAIARCLAPVPRDEYAGFLCAGTVQDLSSRPDLVTMATKLALRRSRGIDVPLHELSVRLEPIEPNVFLPQSNLETFGLDAAATHETVQNAIHAVGGRTRRIADMKFHRCVTGFEPDDLPLFEEKLDFIERSVSPDSKRTEFRRVIEVGGLPSLRQAVRDRSLKLDRLIEIRESEPCREFRRFLATSDEVSDKDVKEMADSFRAKVGAFVATEPGKVLRFVATTAIGFLPGAAQALGLLAGAADAFLLDRLVKSSGPAAFLSAMYPSLFDRSGPPPSNRTRRNAPPRALN